MEKLDFQTIVWESTFIRRKFGDDENGGYRCNDGPTNYCVVLLEVRVLHQYMVALKNVPAR